MSRLTDGPARPRDHSSCRGQAAPPCPTPSALQLQGSSSSSPFNLISSPCPPPSAHPALSTWTCPPRLASGGARAAGASRPPARTSLTPRCRGGCSNGLRAAGGATPWQLRAGGAQGGWARGRDRGAGGGGRPLPRPRAGTCPVHATVCRYPTRGGRDSGLVLQFRGALQCQWPVGISPPRRARPVSPWTCRQGPVALDAAGGACLQGQARPPPQPDDAEVSRDCMPLEGAGVTQGHPEGCTACPEDLRAALSLLGISGPSHARISTFKLSHVWATCKPLGGLGPSSGGPQLCCVSLSRCS